MTEPTSLDRLNALNRENQKTVTVTVGLLKSARSEINAHVAVNGEGVFTRMVLSSLDEAIKQGGGK